VLSKTCNSCKIVKPTTEFHKCARNKDGLQRKCKSCASELSRAWYHTHVAHKKNTSKEWWSRNVERGLMLAARYRAKRDGLPFSIRVEDISIPKYCPILGTELKQSAGSGGGPTSPSLDRIIPELGYVPGNIQVISGLANRLKTDATPKELLKFAEWVRVTYA
jgi:hypothetical protein